MNRITHKARQTVHRVSPSHIVRRYSTRRVIAKFATDLGFVYFGYLDQYDDEHRLLRGITASKTHDDYHYTVGTYKSYDIALTVRRDALTYPDKRIKDHFWTIMTIDLHSESELPHIYMSHHKIRDELLARYTTLRPVVLGTFATYPKKFIDNYELYAPLDRTIEVQQIVTPELAQLLMHYFAGMNLELVDDTLYLYVTEKHPTRALLERMLSTGVWLAQLLDQKPRS